MEPEGVSPRSKKSACAPYPEQLSQINQFTAWHPTEDLF